jgi:hypothetical protein
VRTTLLLLCFWTTVLFAQEKSPSCEVYMVDIAAQQAIKNPYLLSETEKKDLEAKTVRTLGRFSPDLHEESLTTRFLCYSRFKTIRNR